MASPTSPRTDHELLDLWRLGDGEAGEELFDRYYDLIYRFFASRWPTDPRDLVQQTFVWLVEARERIALSRDIRADLLAAADFVLRGVMRKRFLRRVPGESKPLAGVTYAAPEHLAAGMVDEIGHSFSARPAHGPRTEQQGYAARLPDGGPLHLDDTTEDEPLGSGTHLRRVRMEVALDGDLAQLDLDMFLRIIEEAREKSGDPALSITSVELGSILLELDASAEAAALLEKLFESGDLRSLGGLRILAIQRVHAELPGPRAAAVLESAHAALADFLTSAFAADELRRFVYGCPDGARLEAALPGASASLSQLAFEIVRVFVRQGLIGAALDRLEAERPLRYDEIRRIRQRFDGITDAGPHSPSR